MTKLNKRRCKQCGDVFQKIQPLQFVCGYECSISYAIEQEGKKRQKESKEKTKAMKRELYPKKYKSYLQDEINTLARKIDAHFNYPCIDCGKPYGNLVHGAHRHNVGGNENIRFNLHNIHSARAYCNTLNTEHKSGYDIGLQDRYGSEYYKFVKWGIKQKYKSINLLPVEVDEALKIVRKLNRDFDTFILNDSISARDMFNKLIGIYK